MKLLRWLTAGKEAVEAPYSAEVLCAGWVPAGRSELPMVQHQGVATERLREADAPTFLARIYTSQHC